MKIGCCIKVDDIKFVQMFGYDYAELSAKEIMKFHANEWKSKKEEILNTNVPILGFSAFADETTPIIGPNADSSQWEIYLDTVLCRASQLHCKNIGIGAPTARMIPQGYSYKKAEKEMEQFLCSAAKKAKSYGITILYEALNPKECNFGTSTVEIYDMVKRIGHPNLKIVYDVYHVINAKETYQDTAKFFDEIHHIHICSWDKQLNRYYLFPQDAAYVKELSVFLRSVGYNRTISIEAFDADFIHTGASSAAMLKAIFKNQEE